MDAPVFMSDDKEDEEAVSQASGESVTIQLLNQREVDVLRDCNGAVI